MASTHTIYRLEAYDFSSNHFGVGRAEEYRFATHGHASTYEEAEEMVLNISKEMPDAILLMEHIVGEENRTQFMKEFCFTDPKYIRYRRYFIDNIPKKEIEQALKNVGIQVIRKK